MDAPRLGRIEDLSNEESWVKRSDEKPSNQEAFMDDAGKFSHALDAVLYAARSMGCDPNHLMDKIKEDMLDNNRTRPLPQDQEIVIRMVEDAIKRVAHNSAEDGS